MNVARVLVAGGGTGGHLFPGVAVLEALRERLPALQVHWVGTSRGLEARVLPERGVSLHVLQVAPLKGAGLLGVLRGLSSVPGALLRSYGLLRTVRPDLVIGVGGYASGPVLLAASARGIPTALLEQNARVGLTNRLLSPVVSRAYVSFEETVSAFPPGRARVFGNPVRRAFVAAAAEVAADPEGTEQRADRVLVLGGSQGARRLNETVPDAVARAAAGVGSRALKVVHQTGVAACEVVRRRYERLGLEAEVSPFIDDVAEQMSRAAVVVARAGATTVAELCAIGRPSVLVPYPHAADDHQRANAEALQRRGAARCLPESDLSVETLARWIEALWRDEAERLRMASAARALGRPGAAGAIAEDLLDWLGGGRGHASDGGSGSGGVTDRGGGRGGMGAERKRSEPMHARGHGVEAERGGPRGGRLVASEGVRWTQEPGGRPERRARGQRPYVPGRRRAPDRRSDAPPLMADPALLELD